MAVGNTVAISVSLAGAGAILAASAVAFTALKWAGAAYLIGIGLYAIVRRSRAGLAATLAISARAAFLTNVAVGTFHPKTILFFVAFAAQFVDPARPYLPQALVMIATFPLAVAVTDTLYALAGSHTAGLIRRPAMQRWAQRAGGGALVAAGVATATLRR